MIYFPGRCVCVAAFFGLGYTDGPSFCSYNLIVISVHLCMFPFVGFVSFYFEVTKGREGRRAVLFFHTSSRKVKIYEISFLKLYLQIKYLFASMHYRIYNFITASIQERNASTSIDNSAWQSSGRCSRSQEAFYNL